MQFFRSSQHQEAPNPLYRISLNPDKTSVKLWAVVIGLFVLTGCVPDQEVVNVYSSRHYQVDEDLFDQFTEETGIAVNLVKADADQLIKRLELEGSRSNADLLFTVDVGRLNQAKEKGLLQPIDAEAVIEQPIPSHLRDPDNYWLPVTKRARVIVYHKDRVNPEDVSGYKSLTDVTFNDVVLMRSSTNVYNQSLVSAFIHHMGEDATLAWAEQVVDHFARRPAGGDRDQIKAIAAGDGDITIANTYYLGHLKNSSNASERRVFENVALHFPGFDEFGTHVNISGVGLTQHSTNTEHAHKLIRFLLSESAQKAFMNENFEYPVSEGMELEGLLREWGDFDEDSTPLGDIVEHRPTAVRLFSSAGWR